MIIAIAQVLFGIFFLMVGSTDIQFGFGIVLLLSGLARMSDMNRINKLNKNLANTLESLIHSAIDKNKKV